MKKLLSIVVLMCLVGCNEEVPPGTAGRVNTADGWAKSTLKPGRHSCYGRDTLYLVDTTNKTFKENMNILVGGKVNLKVEFSVRVRANVEDQEQLLKCFESVTPDANKRIGVEQLYTTFLQMKAQAIPRQIFESQPDIQTALSSSPQIAAEIRTKITDMAKSTPLIVEDAQITNYDWPASLTQAQEELAKIQLKEASAAAQVRADLKQAEGELKIAEANKLVELKKAETISESIRIIQSELADHPEYLMWHQIKVMGDAANGPNNAFILYPYATDPNQVKGMINNVNLTQMLQRTKSTEPFGPATETTK